MLRTPLFYQVVRDGSSVRLVDNGNRVIAEGMTPQEAREATKRCNVHLEMVNALKDAVDSLEDVNRVAETLNGYSVRVERIRAAKAALANAEA